jgi:hypothetical protein
MTHGTLFIHNFTRINDFWACDSCFEVHYMSHTIGFSSFIHTRKPPASPCDTTRRYSEAMYSTCLVYCQDGGEVYVSQVAKCPPKHDMALTIDKDHCIVILSHTSTPMILVMMWIYLGPIRSQPTCQLCHLGNHLDQ